MKILRNIFIGLGVLFLVLVGSFAFLGMGASNFRNEQSPFISSFMKDLSATWEAASVRGRLSGELLKQIESQEGRNALAAFQTLGRFRSMSDLVLRYYRSGTGGKTGKFTFQGHFTSGPALVEIVVEQKEGKTRVSGLHIVPSGRGPALNVRREI